MNARVLAGLPALLASTLLTPTLITMGAVAIAAPAVAGEVPLYEPMPHWIAPAELAEDRAGLPLLLLDEQQRIEQGRLWSYTDRAVRIDDPQMLSAVGTLQAAWLPDKGDFIVHRVAILRGDEEVDVLGAGARFDVLRRERQLEQRMLDGVLTATMAVPGLRVGDVLRAAWSITMSDQALDKEVQTVALLPTEPFEAGLARLRVSWAEDAEVDWRVSAAGDLPSPVASDGYMTLEVTLPLAAPAPMPDDAPMRYRLPPMLQAGTFSGWEEVSRVMAPLYATDNAVAAGSPLASEIAAIVAREDEPLHRAMAALRLVQDEVAYLLNGMEGGNYIPQSPADTWAMRYGDCKAKTMLLLAMLREMDIEAEAVLVSSSLGDAVPQMLPMPAAFDHVLVRAVIDGAPYWLDGTSSGASLANVGRASPYRHGLALRIEGAGLEVLPQRAPDDFDEVLTLRIDERAGPDLIGLFDAEWTISGPGAGVVRTMIGQATQDQRFDFVESVVNQALGGHWLIEQTMHFDAERNVATIKASSTLPAAWRMERSGMVRDFSLPTTDFEFRPDRTRAAWRDIPVRLAGPQAIRTDLTLLLPPDAEGIHIDGSATLDEDMGGIRLRRTATLSDGQLRIADSAVWPGGELAADQAAQVRTRVAAMDKAAIRLRAPAGSERRHLFAGDGDRSALAAIDDAFARVIAVDPDDAGRYFDRGRHRAWTYDRQGALADLDRAIELEPDFDRYIQRMQLRVEMEDFEGVLADARLAGELQPGAMISILMARAMSELGQIDEAIALLADFAATDEERPGIVMTLSDLEALAGRKDEGLALIDEMLGERPGDPTLLNAKCWYQAIWNHRPEDLAELCTRAVEWANWAPPVLDSRAFGYYRLGRYEDALNDLEAALSISPDQMPSLYLRGIVRLALGDEGGERDIGEALLRHPWLERQYARYGLTVR